MKSLKLSMLMSLIMGILLFFNQASAQETKNTVVTKEFKVYGNCGMCKKTIEKSLKDQAGVNKAVWDAKTKMMTVSYDSKKITLDVIKEKIAAVGYDTDTHRAKDKVYNALHGCCQYERPE